MEQKRHTWLRSRRAFNERRETVREFRSDNDLYQFWVWGRVAVPMTLLCYGALRSFGVPFDYTPLAVIPAVIFYVTLRILAQRSRKAGKRFSDYETDDISW